MIKTTKRLYSCFISITKRGLVLNQFYMASTTLLTNCFPNNTQLGLGLMLQKLTYFLILYDQKYINNVSLNVNLI